MKSRFFSDNHENSSPQSPSMVSKDPTGVEKPGWSLISRKNLKYLEIVTILFWILSYSMVQGLLNVFLAIETPWKIHGKVCFTDLTN